ncbi:hypothetical protein N7481_000699 [Penicillium waksmanii]|uniref:uncharacterized protein n=1 Tax=Penicillium waksmanii TaxID=69791 RepID=UPI00254976D9|nr:uncharacterized protein N7481_000699 [Penicillium waksmanii]KAJ6000290.1 hypothetical protein N7481_000699 [Penicillium waksmanii]
MKPIIFLSVLFILASAILSESIDPVSKEAIPKFVENITIADTQDLRHEEEHTRLQARLDRGSQVWDGNHPRQRLLTALYGFRQYKERHLEEIQRWRSLYKKVSKSQQKTIESAIKYNHKLNTVEHLIDINDKLAQEIVQTGLHFYDIPQSELDKFSADQIREGKKADRTSVAQAMKHFVRDWAEEGQNERKESFTCLLGQLDSMDREINAPLKVLVPGGGIGRLAHEIARLDGFEVTMNEWSMYMNLVYRQIMRQPIISNAQSYHPWLDWWSHHATTSDMQRSVSFPDSPINKPAVLLVEGDFTTVFNGEEGKYDVLVTLFFIDTARNILTYLETIHRLLQPGGAWLNLGPLLYGTAPFLQLSLDEIISLAEAVGFRIEDPGDVCGDVSLDGLPIRAKEISYGRNVRGLNRNGFLAQSWRAIKL